MKNIFIKEIPELKFIVACILISEGSLSIVEVELCPKTDSKGFLV